MIVWTLWASATAPGTVPVPADPDAIKPTPYQMRWSFTPATTSETELQSTRKQKNATNRACQRIG